MTPAQLIDWACSRFEESELFYGHGTDNAFDEAAFMVLRTLQIEPVTDDSGMDQPLTETQVDNVKAAVEERIRTRKPAAYIMNEAWFASLPFYVDENVLVPRSPFAELIQEQFSPWCVAEKVTHILDIGTGCGCIAIACALAFPEATVDAIDISPAALKVAAENIRRHCVQDRVTLFESDLFQELPGRKYDLIIANPPYVDAEDMRNLPPEFRHEPALGLQAGRDGLDIVHRILAEAAGHLTENGILAVEVGNSRFALVEQYPQVPFLWLEFEHGGEGVFLLSKDDLCQLKK